MIKISACTIVRDEERNIARWLDNVKTFADEIIVVDTGSKDGTKNILRQYGVDCFDFVWCNDFSAAKNYAIEQATGDWLIFLDADEYFDKASQSKIREIINGIHYDIKIAGIITPFSNIDVKYNNEVLSKGWQMRIFRREKNLVFVGKIHESLQNMAPAGQDRDFIVREELHFIHTGYSREIVKTKLKRNLELILQDIKEQGGVNPRQYGYLQDCYMGLKEYDKAIYYGRLAFKHRHETGLIPQENAMICKILFAIQESGLGDYGFELKKVLDFFPNFPELWFLYGRYQLCVLGQGILAEQSFHRALQLDKNTVKNVNDLYNSTIGDLSALTRDYLSQINKYREYYQFLVTENYQQAASTVKEYLLGCYRRYPKEV